MVEVAGNLSIQYRADLNILFCRFVQPTSSALLRFGYENALQTAQQQQARFWLFDLRRRGPALAADEDWILSYFFPHVERITQRRQYFAYLVTPTHYLHVQEAVGLEKLANYSQLTQISVFDSEDKAMDWLSQNQTADSDFSSR